MEEERGLGNIFYFIVIAIIAIISSIRNKKKQGGTGAGQQIPERPSFPDDAFDDYMPSYEDEQDGGRQAATVRPAAAATPGSDLRTTLAGSFSQEGMSSLDIATTAGRFDKLIASSSDIDYEKDFREAMSESRAEELNWIFDEEPDWKKAVIFSEIINRKEY